MRIPLFIEFEGKKVLIIGGGGVGTSRAKKFIEAGAVVKVLSLAFSDELKELEKAGKVELIEGDAFDRRRLEELLSWSDLVTVAIPNLEVNDLIIDIAKKHKTLVNLANDAEKTEVVVPFEGEVEGIRFAVTTEGKSGVVARKVRDSFRKMLEEDEETLYFLKAMYHLKQYMKANNVPVQLRMKLYFVIAADPEFRKLVSREDIEGARRYVEKLVEEYVSGKRKIDESLVKMQF
ncbi:precorrin-2 dehydrogenase/sirohydrochlorin ferrochelatase family protein [Archaeoglobus veneficus]|uniref:precorrin-2 dehydrogenase n=1 Tax=Archaeoglobus veneficus (strain DSM 11195 / SNP6) TaxID=693661 RepID=F2KQ31_ARCVS|nr:bifunctional precorrin-2 dehydrogenase/sirohydrochlorin ferrochelatase [Archaeoglobus veneficus]AEA47634.1 siroheme synthase [Archaeoglobus veneficus SNP6]